jgi:hypothetical protein
MFLLESVLKRLIATFFGRIDFLGFLTVALPWEENLAKTCTVYCL